MHLYNTNLYITLYNNRMSTDKSLVHCLSMEGTESLSTSSIMETKVRGKDIHSCIMCGSCNDVNRSYLDCVCVICVII